MGTPPPKKTQVGQTTSYKMPVKKDLVKKDPVKPIQIILTLAIRLRRVRQRNPSREASREASRSPRREARPKPPVSRRGPEIPPRASHLRRLSWAGSWRVRWTNSTDFKPPMKKRRPEKQ